MSLKPQRHHCADQLYSQPAWTIGDTIFCTCNRAYRLCEPSLLLAITFWRGHTSYTSGVWVRDRNAERRDRKVARRG